jgi:hypothetical protein
MTVRDVEIGRKRGRSWKWRGWQHLPEQIDADERLPGYLREPHLPPFESRRARVLLGAERVAALRSALLKLSA